MNVATLKDKVHGPDRETKSRQVTLTWRTDLVATKEFKVVTYFKLKRSFDIATGILRSRHKNKLNTDKQGRDRIKMLKKQILRQQTVICCNRELKQRIKTLSQHF